MSSLAHLGQRFHVINWYTEDQGRIASMVHRDSDGLLCKRFTNFGCYIGSSESLELRANSQSMFPPGNGTRKMTASRVIYETGHSGLFRRMHAWKIAY
jgi:hypothetical protein